MGRVFFAMSAGRNRNLPVYLSLETIQNACHQVFPNEDTDALIDDLLAMPAEGTRQERAYGDDDTALINQLEKKVEAHWMQVSAYDLREPDNLRRWRPGLKIEPHLEDALLGVIKKVNFFSVKREYQKFLDSDRVEQENYFFRHNRYVLIGEDV